MNYVPRNPEVPRSVNKGSTRIFDYKVNNNNNKYIIPVIIRVTGIVTRSLRKNLEAVPGKHSTYSLQKTAILGTSHIIRKVLHCET
jgi:hypothetical protein